MGMRNMHGALKQAYNAGLLDWIVGMGGKLIYLDPANGGDSSAEVGNKERPFSTLASAYDAARAGKNDTIVLVGDGTTTATARVNSAFTWAKNATHIIGLAPPAIVSQRARIAPTGSTTAFANFFTISAAGCLFQNVQLFHGFDTDTSNQIAVTISGGRNTFRNVHIAGGTKGDDTGARSLLITGSTGENLFEDCTLGLDTVDRSVAAATLEFASGSPRNVFRRCLFPFRATNAAVLAIKVAAAAGMDRFQLFERCLFVNHNTTMTALATLAASTGGFLVFDNCTLVKITGFGSDATTRGQVWVSGAGGTAATTGLAVAPTA